MHNYILQIIFLLLLLSSLLIIIRSLYRKILVCYQSKISGKITVYKNSSGEVFLALNGFVQSVDPRLSKAKNTYWEFISQKVLNLALNKNSFNVLILGLGGNTIPAILSSNPRIRQTIVEIDKYIIKAARNFFDLDKLPNYQLIQADVYKLMDDKYQYNPLNKKTFDVVIVDLFIGTIDNVSPQSSDTNFINQIITYLKPSGTIIFNRPNVNCDMHDVNLKIMEQLKILFQITEIVYIEDSNRYKNSVILAQARR